MFTTIQTKLHNPTAKKKSILDEVFRQYTEACRESLSVLRSRYEEIERAVTYTSTAGKQRISTEQRISKQIRPILQAEVLNKFNLSGALNDSAIKWVASNLKSHFELKLGLGEEKDTAVFPSVPRVQDKQNEFAEMLSLFAEAKTKEEETVARNRLLRFTFRERVLPISFVRSRDCRRFKSNEGKYYVQLPTLAAAKQSPLLSNSERLFKGKRSKTHMTFPLSFGDFQLNYLEDREATVRASHLIKKQDGYYLHFNLELPDKFAEFKPEAVLGIDLGMTDVATYSLLDMQGKILEQGQYDGAERKKRLNQFRDYLQSEQMRGRSTAGITIRNLSKQMVHEVVNDLLKIAEERKAIVSLEDLGKIRNNRPRDRCYRRAFNNWDFGRFKEIISYKAERKGIPLYPLWSSYSSQTCSRCGATNKGRVKWVGEYTDNGKFSYEKIKSLKDGILRYNGNNVGKEPGQRPVERLGEKLKEMRCHSCGYCDDADKNASAVIAQRGLEKYFEHQKRREQFRQQRSLTT